MAITIAGTKEYLKMLFKNGTAEMLYFFVGLYFLMTEAPHIINVDMFRMLILIGIWVTFIGITLRLGLSLFQFVVLYIGETIDKYKNKEWTLESSIRDQTLAMAEDTTHELTDYIKKSRTEDEAKLNGLKQLDEGITEKHPEIKQEIADLEAKLSELEN